MSVNPNSKYTEKDLNWFRILFQRFVVWSLIIIVNQKFKFKVEGRENIPGLGNTPKAPSKSGSFIIAANHLSTWDPPFISVAFSPYSICYMGKEELFETFWSQLFYRTVGVFSVNRHKIEISTIKTAKVVLNSGNWHLGMFPEGTRNKDGEGVQEVKKGVAFIAKSTHAPILPVGISRSPTNPKEITVRIGQIIPCEGTIESLSQELHLSLLSLVQGGMSSGSCETSPSESSNVISLAKKRDEHSNDP
jgi:1-acyl-sn-glycerol-3-phosphate acyltransferase